MHSAAVMGVQQSTRASAQAHLRLRELEQEEDAWYAGDALEEYRALAKQPEHRAQHSRAEAAPASDDNGAVRRDAFSVPAHRKEAAQAPVLVNLGPSFALIMRTTTSFLSLYLDLVYEDAVEALQHAHAGSRNAPSEAMLRAWSSLHAEVAKWHPSHYMTEACRVLHAHSVKAMQEHLEPALEAYANAHMPSVQQWRCLYRVDAPAWLHSALLLATRQPLVRHMGFLVKDDAWAQLQVNLVYNLMDAHLQEMVQASPSGTPRAQSTAPQMPGKVPHAAAAAAAQAQPPQGLGVDAQQLHQGGRGFEGGGGGESSVSDLSVATRNALLAVQHHHMGARGPGSRVQDADQGSPAGTPLSAPTQHLQSASDMRQRSSAQKPQLAPLSPQSPPVANADISEQTAGALRLDLQGVSTAQPKRHSHVPTVQEPPREIPLGAASVQASGDTSPWARVWKQAAQQSAASNVQRVSNETAALHPPAKNQPGDDRGSGMERTPPAGVAAPLPPHLHTAYATHMYSVSQAGGASTMFVHSPTPQQWSAAMNSIATGCQERGTQHALHPTPLKLSAQDLQNFFRGSAARSQQPPYEGGGGASTPGQHRGSNGPTRQ